VLGGSAVVRSGPDGSVDLIAVTPGPAAVESAAHPLSESQARDAAARLGRGAPVAARAPLFALYAFNLEVARAPWVTQEAMIAEMRLQWWRDTVEELGGPGPVRAHEVVAPLAEVVRDRHLSLAVMDRLTFSFDAKEAEMLFVCLVGLAALGPDAVFPWNALACSLITE
jgi:hypothetical protein